MSSRDFSPAAYPLYAGDVPPAVPGEPEAGLYAAQSPRWWLHGLLLGLTLLTTSIVGAAMQADFDRNLPFDYEGSFSLYLTFWKHPAILLQGLPFSLTLLTILLAHEMGHYLAAMYHGVDASLPYFMPSPLLGTFGAFIRVRSPIYSKRVLFDIGIAGPLAGFVFVLPSLAIGLALSKVIPGIAHQSSMHFGVPMLQRLLESAIFPGAHAADIYLHPVARAAWVGMFATALNLLPIGQLDGGHVIYSFLPRQHKAISKVCCVLLLPLARFWYPWAVWSLLLLWLGRRHPVIDDPAPMSRGRAKLAWLALIIFILCFIYDPISPGGL